MNKRLYVGNLLYEVQDTDLQEAFAQYGTVVSASVVRFSDSGRSKGFGFVEMAEESEAQAAVDGLNNSDFKGRTIFVSVARPPRERSERGGDRGFGGGRGGDRGGRGASRGGDRPRYDRGGGRDNFSNDDFGGDF